MNKSYLILVASLVAVQQAQPIFYGLQILRKLIPGTKKHAYVWGLQDHHQILPNLSEEQQRAFLTALKNKKPHGTLIVTEDKHAAPKNNPVLYKLAHDLYQPSPESTLLGLTEKLDALGYTVVNAECRFIQGVACQFLNEYVTKKNKTNEDITEYKALFKEYNLTVHACIQEVTTTLTSGQKSLKGTVLEHFVEELSRTLKKDIAALFPQNRRVLIAEDTTIFDYYLNLPVHEQKAFMDNLGTFQQSNWHLTDLRAVELIMQYPEKTTIILCMGGSHVETVLSLLYDLGFKEIYSIACEPELDELKTVDEQQSLESRKLSLAKKLIKPLDEHLFAVLADSEYLL